MLLIRLPWKCNIHYIISIQVLNRCRRPIRCKYTCGSGTRPLTQWTLPTRSSWMKIAPPTSSLVLPRPAVSPWRVCCLPRHTVHSRVRYRYWTWRTTWNGIRMCPPSAPCHCPSTMMEPCFTTSKKWSL